ncbi:hypothetical protein M409DRAFT_17032 [Zasmidium cellare ATCC 36951]|uniref:Uncharacterized protein n=1 Tax=Zasmidium cellare ATCC 36951 TaxID=1080233 RepID=A0A6A6D0X4_ZASCE|nr:uncharacterized protein M409DRAFT_17032 [Zasmidium cellare ATCC 36951]KAF2173084.1 hypothetical protein M409DRAFT_17032 [Zasmidium cellare ATCC 36951]
MVKRKAVDDETSSNKKATLTATTAKHKAPKKGTTSTRKGKGKKSEDVQEAEPPKPRVKRINKTLKAKVKQVGDFLDTTSREDSRLKRSSANENHVIITEACLLASLMAMRADWELTDPRMASLLDASEAIVEQYEEKWASSEQLVRMVAVDLEKKTAFVEGIQQKIEGWDLEGINLLEVELELTQQRAEDEAAFRLFSTAETAVQATDASNETIVETETTEIAAEISASEVEAGEANEGDAVSTKNSITLEKESGREGVCPAPIKEL